MAYTVSAPAFEPVTLALAKEWLKVSDTSEDTTITALIQTAREFAENHTARYWAERTVTEYWDGWPDSDTICPTLGPASAITSVSYIADGDTGYTTFNSSNYATDVVSETPRIVLKEASSWPTLESLPNAVKVVYVVGYTPTANVPEAVKTGMRLLIALWFENREDLPTPNLQRTAQMILNVEKRHLV